MTKKLFQMWHDEKMDSDIDQFCKEYGFKSKASMVRVAITTFMKMIKSRKDDGIKLPNQEDSMD